MAMIRTSLRLAMPESSFRGTDTLHCRRRYVHVHCIAPTVWIKVTTICFVTSGRTGMVHNSVYGETAT